MSFQIAFCRRLGIVLAAAAVVAALTASVASAGSPDALDRYVRSHAQTDTVTCDAICRFHHEPGTPDADTLGGVGKPAGIRLITDTLGDRGRSVTPNLAPDAVDRYVVNRRPGTVTTTVSTSSSGWPTVAVAGTAVSCAMLTLLVASLVVVLRRRRSTAA